MDTEQFLDIEQLPESNRRIAHRSEMLERPSTLVAWFYRTFFRHVRVDVRYIELVRDLASRGTVVYVMRSKSLINYLFFNALLLSHGLPLARFSNGHSMLPFQRFGAVLYFFWTWLFGGRRDTPVEFLKKTVAANESALLFLRTPRTLTSATTRTLLGSRDQDEFIPALLQLQRTQERPIFLLPQLLIWERRPAKERRSLLDVVFGEVSDPGLLRQFWLFLLNYKSASVKVGDPVNLQDHAEAAENDPEIARRVRGKIIGYLAREFRVVLGPQLKETSTLKGEILQSRKLGSQIEALVTEKTSEETLRKKARSMLDEIAANLEFRVIEILGWILKRVFDRIFDGIEFDPREFERVRDASRRGPLLLIPSHKSHIDYLLLSYLFFQGDLMPPHIAAGKNLSFWPLGPLFRRAGAFFLRRSFKEDKLYSAVFRSYVRRLVRDGHNIEFFIEGSRSRSGKLLQPKFGMLGMVVDAYLEGTGKEVQVLPISIAYEKLLEDKSYKKELLGGQKKEESVGGVLRATKVLRSTYGRIHVRFAETISLTEYLAQHGLVPAELGSEYRATPPDEEVLRNSVRELGYRIVQRINEVTVVTPSALVATILLTHPRRGIARRELDTRAAFLIELLRKRGALFSTSLQGEPSSQETSEALQEAIFLFHKSNYVTIHDQGDLVVYSVNAEWRISLDYYKNNLMHQLIEPAIVATALLHLKEEASFVDLSRVVKELSRILKQEFLFRADASLEDNLRQALQQLLALRVLDGSEADGYRIAKGQLSTVQFFYGLTLPFLEAIWVSALCLEDLAGKPMSEKEFKKQVHARCNRMYLTGEIKRQESNNDIMFQNAIALFLERSMLQQSTSPDPKAKPLLSLGSVAATPEGRSRITQDLFRYLHHGA